MCFSRFYSEHCFTDDARQICLKTSWKVVIKVVYLIAFETDISVERYNSKCCN
jgi:hypothetical protein